jgi:pimeloyl-ACP methyl ester carboxylesterase
MDLSQRIAVNGIELAWDSWGDPDAPTIVLCHGYGGSAHGFSLQIESLAERWRVVAFDQRGHGRSGRTGELAGNSADELSADLNALVEAIGRPPVTVLGHSLGGRVALGAVLARPDLYRSLVLQDTTAWSFAPTDEAFRDLIAGIFESFDPAVGPPNLEIPGPEAELVAVATSVEWQERSAALGAMSDPYALKALGLEMFLGDRVSVRDRLAEITFPVTVIVGEFDEPFAGQAPELVAELPDGELVVIRGGFHMPQVTHQDAWRRAVDDHLRSVHRA